MLQSPLVHAEAVRRARSRWPRALLPWLVGGAAAILGFAGSWIPSYWGDEAASVMSAERSWPSLAGLLGTIDAVHGLYYAVLRLWIGVFGATEVATRLPSAIAAGLMVAGVVVLARGFAGDRLAITAGFVATILPRTTSMATEARSYALGAAAAVWLTVLLVHLLRRRSRLGGWVGYAVCAAACLYLFVFLGLLLLVHGLFVALIHRDRVRIWSLSTGAALLLAAPILVLGYQERSQIAFLARRDYATARHVLVSQWFGQPVVAIVAWVLVAAAIGVFVSDLAHPGTRDRARQHLTVLAVLWLVLPSAVLLVGDVASPLYNVRYLSFCTPAAAILIAIGAGAAARLRTPHVGRILPLALVTMLMLASVPAYLGQRTPWAKDGGSDWRAVAQYVATHADKDDAVIFDQTTKPSRDPRILISLYPRAFAGLKDPALATRYSARPHLWDAVVPNAIAITEISGPADVWAVELPAGGGTPADIAMLLHDGFRIETTHRLHRTSVYHLTKE